MPIYEYKCKECGEEFEELVSLSNKISPPCPDCGSKETERKISRVGGFSGSGTSIGGSCGSSGFS